MSTTAGSWRSARWLSELRGRSCRRECEARASQIADTVDFRMKKLARCRSRFGKAGVCKGVPLPYPSENLPGRGVYKKCLQNLDVKELRGQNLEKHST